MQIIKKETIAKNVLEKKRGYNQHGEKNEEYKYCDNFCL